MRPLQLTLRGFGPFRDEQKLDFSDVDAFALVGPTGSGKSTVLDAMCFALYGKVPRHGKGAATGDVLSSGTNEMVVALTFDVRDEKYIVVRVVRRKGKAGKPTTAEARLEHIVEGGDTVPMANGATEVDAAVQALVGLSFEHFTRCVLLPQGEFARFLHDEPRDRRALLLRLLDLGFYDEMRARAEAISKEQKTRASVLDEQRQLAGSTDVDEAALAARATALTELDAVLAQAEPELARVDSALAVADATVRELDAQLVALAAVAVPDDLATLELERSADLTERDRLDAAAVEAVARCEALAADRAKLPAAKAVSDVLALHARVPKGRDVVATLADAVAKVAKATAKARDVLASADAALAERRADHLAATRQHAAHALAVTVQVGEACPVCRRTIDSLPLVDVNVAFDEIGSAVTAAERTLADARTNADAAAKAEAEAASKHREQAGRLAEMEEALAGQPEPAALEKTLMAITEFDRSVEAATAERDRCREAARSFRSREADYEKRQARHLETFHRQRDALQRLDPPAPSGALLGDWQQLVIWATDARAHHEVRREEAAEASASASRERAALLNVVAEAVVAADADIASSGSIGAMRIAVVQAGAVIAATRERAAAERARVGQLDADAAAAKRRSDVAAALGQHLRSNNFQDWLVSEAIESLAAAASDTLLSLSDGAYSLVYRDDTFAVVDHVNGDDVRSARSLSGGETFQASLALAFALGDEIARQRSAARLDAVFLDEGFGTLDPESLDKVAGTIAELSDGRRLVGLVTHVAELAQRQPVRFRVNRNGRSSTITRESD
jgi:DNA repair protein SbcC/Rad50